MLIIKLLIIVKLLIIDDAIISLRPNPKCVCTEGLLLVLCMNVAGT